jgi:hypothetical protein
MLPRAANPSQQRQIRAALERQDPAFTRLHGAQDEARKFTELNNALGRQHANPPPEPSPSLSASLYGGPATIMKDVAILLKRAAESGAMKGAGKQNRELDIEDLLRLIGHRTAGQRITQGTVSPIVLGMAGNALGG